MTFRFRDLGIISQSYYGIIFTWINQNGFKVNELGSDSLTFQEEPLAFRSNVLRAYSEGLISESEVARFLPGHQLGGSAHRLGSSSEIKRLLSLPREERDKVLAAATRDAVGDYKDSEMNVGDLTSDAEDYT
jgi:hypothetical protein